LANKASDAPPATSELAKPSTDVALIVGATPDGKGAQILRARQGKVELGALHPLREGAPIHGEVVQLKPRSEAPNVCDVEVLVPSPSAPTSSDVAAAPSGAGHKGPARVASDAYRQNWDAIWSRGEKRELLN
jgi:hypothetical protein